MKENITGLIICSNKLIIKWNSENNSIINFTLLDNIVLFATDRMSRLQQVSYTLQEDTSERYILLIYCWKKRDKYNR